eukprot:m.92982 g.92982  ORF g.92982 m.92982 type:complete len:635 (-) comp12377_c0_seq1:172-2076(-)
MGRKFHRLKEEEDTDSVVVEGVVESAVDDSVERSQSTVYRKQLKRRKKIRRFIVVYSVAILFVTFFLIAVILSSHETNPPQHFDNGAVAADAAECSTIGVNVLRDGGNAVDAAVATALCLGVVHGESSGLGGGGFLLVYNATTRESSVIDFRETAPMAADTYMYTHDSTCTSDDADERRLCSSRLGGLASGVPGELRGLETAWTMFGRSNWTELVLPSVKLARDGFTISKHTADSIMDSSDIARSPLLSLFLNDNGELLREGETMRRPKLAETLMEIALNGSHSFYEGEIADGIIEALNNDESAGLITRADLRNYTPLVRSALVSDFNEFKIISAPAPASGSVLAMILSVLSHYGSDISSEDALTLHRTDESFRFAYAKRTLLADPCCGDNTNTCDNTTQCDSVTQIQTEMINNKNTLKWKNKITDDRTHHNTSYYGAHYDVEETPGTTHFSVVDAEGNAVAMTSTVNLLWGSKVLTKHGIVMNNEMDDFSSPGIVNAFGVSPSPANFIKPFKRPLSSSAPTIALKNGRVHAVAGASGGTKITTSTAQVLLHMLGQNMTAQDAVFHPRIHDQLLPDYTLAEKRVSSAIRKGLEARGHNWKETESIAVTQAILVDDDGVLWPSSDFRKGGKADGY